MLIINYLFFMQNTKLVAILKTLDKDEIKRFGDFVQSPYFNKREANILFFKALVVFYPNFENLLWEKIFKKAFPEKEYKEVYLRNILSDLYSLAENFLMQEHRLLLPMRNKIDFCYELAMRDLFPLAEKQLAILEKELNECQATDGYYHDWLVWYDRLADWVYFKLAQPNKRAPILQEKINNLFGFFWKYILSLYGAILNTQGLFDSYTYDTTQIEAILPLFNPTQYAHNPTLLCEYYTVMLLRPTANDINFEDTYNFIQQNKQHIDKQHLDRLYTVLTAVLGKKPLADNKDTALLLTLHLDSIDLRMQEQLHLSVYTYDSVTNIGYWLKGATWVQAFIANYTHYLPAQLREGWRIFVEARLLLFEGRAADVITMLNVYPDFYEQDYFYTKFILLFAYYETQNVEAFALLADTLAHTLKNRKETIPERRHPEFKNTLYLLQKLQQQPNADDFNKLQQWFADTPEFYQKKWLIEKVIFCTK